MSKHNKINELKAKLKKEYESGNVNNDKVKKLRKQIMMLGLRLTGRDLTKPF